jgi:hypothetical protein
LVIVLHPQWRSWLHHLRELLGGVSCQRFSAALQAALPTEGVMRPELMSAISADKKLA